MRRPRQIPTVLSPLYVLLATVLWAAPLTAGVVFEIETTDHGQTPPKVESTQIQAEGKNIKMDIAAGDRGGRGGTAIFRGDRQEMVVVEHSDQSFMVVDQETLQEVGDQLAGVNSQIAEALKNVPEDQRAMLEKMMKERMPPQAVKRPATEVRKTGEHGEKNGYPCEKYEVLREGRKTRELWVTDWSNVEGGEEVAEAFRSMAGLLKKLLDQLPTNGGQGGLGDAVMLQMNELQGFPVVTRELDDDGSLERESFLRSSRRRTLDPADFEPPAGYKRRSMFGG